MMKIKRNPLIDCTLGVLTYGRFRCLTLELPYIFNVPDISSIPNGLYNCIKINSPNLGDCIEIQDVLGRTLIRIHAGNTVNEIKGCILVGVGYGDLNGDRIPDVLTSKDTLEKLLSILPNEFKLEIS